MSRATPRPSTIFPLPVLAFAFIVAVILATLPGNARAAAFPLYDRVVTHSDTPTTTTWYLYPFFSDRETTGTRTIAMHPLWDWHVEHESGARAFDLLFPLYTWRHYPEQGRFRDVRRHFLFPIYYHRTDIRDGRPYSARIFIPFWYSGDQGGRGTYRILFPFFWYAYNAELAVPLFPSRPQTFAAFWPLIGDFRGYYNRDRIFFFLWPVIVYSSRGTGEDFIETSSLVWPLFAIHGGTNTSGFRIWPLFSTVSQKDRFSRSYWLWPLGHRRTGEISESDNRQQDVTLFIPFYARIRRPDFNFDMIFPFYGSLEVGMRKVDGYALGIYNVERNERRGTREDRLFWFLWRWRKPLEGRTVEDVADDVTLGGGLFPFYIKVENEKSQRKVVAWPIYHHRWNKYQDYEFEREYVVPFYSSQEWRFQDGRERRRRFFFPFFRQVKSLDGTSRTNSLHLWFHTEVEAVDRLYAPMWEFWRRGEDPASGEAYEYWFQNAHRFERRSDGTERRRTNLLLFQRETTRDAEGELQSGSTRLFWGLLGTHRSEERGREIELLWMRF